ncbi:DUF3994 domain-containing protein [Niallia sp. Krafla_26]|uniref:DUF3994 domain-containing protein n=1 Tax=Niallia sp. Krafla_26 TaxID=3064703 RepID=UPI003D163A88
MIVKWGMGLAISIALLAGCNSVVEQKTTQEVQNEVKAEQLSFEEFTKEAVRLRSKFSTSIQEFGEIRQNQDMEQKQWQETYLGKVDAIRDVIKEFRTIAPPDDKEQIGQEIKVALDEFDKGMILYKEAIQEGDANKDRKALDHMAKGQDYWNHAFALLSINNPIPVEGSDGTIDTQDLKDLDLNAGIDRDSVLLNVTEDGKELVGQWGFFNDDGTPNVSIVLSEDGSYEGYGNGEFPSKDNALIGTWEWDYLKGVVTFHHEYKNQDGVKGKANRDQMPMELQRYDEKGIQLFDLEAQKTFVYEKVDGKKESSTATSEADEKTTATKTENAKISLSDLHNFWMTDGGATTLDLKEDGNFIMKYKMTNDPDHRYFNGTYELKDSNLVLHVDKVNIDLMKEDKNHPRKEFNFQIESFDGSILKASENGDIWEWEK